MNDSTKVALGIKDPHLELDNKVPEPIKDCSAHLAIYLVQTYPLNYPHCDQLMKRNGF